MVKSVVNPSNEAFGNEYLPCHIDLPYYTQPPSTYFFLCLKNECEVRGPFISEKNLRFSLDYI